MMHDEIVHAPIQGKQYKENGLEDAYARCVKLNFHSHVQKRMYVFENGMCICVEPHSRFLAHLDRVPVYLVMYV
jgi:hypothetical protein